MERLLQGRLGKSAEVSSAGVMAIDGHPMDPLAAEQLLRLGGSAEGFRSRDFVRQYAEEADLILTATAEIRSRVLEECPSALRQTLTMLEFAYLAAHAPAELTEPRDLIAWAAQNRSLASSQELDIPDPIGQPPGVHQSVADLMNKSVDVVAFALSRQASST